MSTIMFDYEEIDRTVSDNNLPLQKIEGIEKDELLQRLHETFVIGDPRALWLSFRYVAESIDCGADDPYWHLPDVIDKDATLYFIIDYWNTDFVVFKGRMSDIHTFIGDCEGLDEFYLMTPDFKKLYSITDHDDLYYIDVNENKLKIPRFKVDFNELVNDDLVLFSKSDTRMDVNDNTHHLTEGMEIEICEIDYDGSAKRDDMLAKGWVVACDLPDYPHVKWCCRISPDGIRHIGKAAY